MILGMVFAGGKHVAKKIHCQATTAYLAARLGGVSGCFSVELRAILADF
jgi:hypothetical protein